MGFGWLFIGYFFASALAPLFSPLGVLMPVGYGFLLFALWRLRAYHKRLNACFYLTFSMVPFALYYGAYGLSQMGVPLFPSLFTQAITAGMGWAYFGFWCLFQCYLLFAVSALCREIGYLPLVAMGTRNLLFLVIYALLSFLVRLPFLADKAKLFTVPLLLLQLMCVILNLWYFYKCYRTVVPEEMEVKEGTPDETK